MSHDKKGEHKAAMLARMSTAVNDINALVTDRLPVEHLPLERIVPSPFQARFDFSGVDELSEDIRANGVLQPVLVRVLENGQYELIAGERRLRASKLAGRQEIPAMVARNVTDEQARLYGLRENLSRRDLNVYEQAHAVVELLSLQTGRPYQELQAALNVRTPDPQLQAQLAEVLHLLGKRLNYSSFQRRYLRALNLPEHLKEALARGAAYSVVLELEAVPEGLQREWLPAIISGEMTREDVIVAKRALKPARQVQPSSSWEAVATVREYITPQRLSELDGRSQRRAQRLLTELRELLAERATQE